MTQKKMKTIKFWKMSGSGNDFVVIDNRKKVITSSAAATWAKRLCFRQEGVGADGLLLLEPSRTADFRMVYYNADGSRASMCGNGARCMAWFARQHKAVGNRFTFETDAYPVNAVVDGDDVIITLADAKDYRPKLSLQVGAQTLDADFLNTGVPHLVVYVSDVKGVNVATLGRALRYHDAFAPKGTNVNFVQRLGPSRLQIRTYERGVEGETLACGTGVTASAIAAVLRNQVKAPVHCLTAGGDTLKVRLTPHLDNTAQVSSDVSLEGPVRLTFKGEVYV
jgi:diaminopimelate epimerase